MLNSPRKVKYLYTSAPIKSQAKQSSETIFFTLLYRPGVLPYVLKRNVVTSDMSQLIFFKNDQAEHDRAGRSSPAELRQPLSTATTVPGRRFARNFRKLRLLQSLRPNSRAGSG